MKKFLGIFAIAAFGAATGAGVMTFFDKGETKIVEVREAPAAAFTNFTTSTGANVVENPDFIRASAMATPAVVHIKSTMQTSQSNDPWSGLFGNPFGGNMPRGRASGSGVIISADGYIATNNHVVDNAEEVEVTLNDKRSYKATIVGTDPTTDLALLKIEGADFAHLEMGNSDQVLVGEWALAVGNPFNLTSTVTAGIVSAKGRNLNLLNEQFAIESFIQTDAAVNPGNSGGALINTEGKLIGINTAIASETGSYAGYSFAVPVNIVRKVMKDLKEFGGVQRGIIGVQIQNIDSKMAEANGLNTLNGAYIGGLIPGGAAADAGLEVGDIITRVNANQIKSAAELQEVIGTFRPGDKVNLTVLRDDRTMKFDVTLRNKNGTTDLVAVEKEEPRSADMAPQSLGVRLESLSLGDKMRFELESGVKVVEVNRGILNEVGIEKGFIITKVNKVAVDSPEDVEKLISESDGSILMEGVSATGKRQFFAFDY